MRNKVFYGRINKDALQHFTVGGLSLLLPSKPSGSKSFFSTGLDASDVSVFITLRDSATLLRSASEIADYSITAVIKDPNTTLVSSSVKDSVIDRLEAKEAEVVYRDRKTGVESVKRILAFSKGKKTWSISVHYQLAKSRKANELATRIFKSVSILENRDGGQLEEKNEELRHLPTDNRLTNGTNVDNLTSDRSRGQLTVRNGRKSDAHIKIIGEGEKLYEAYIRSDNDIAIDGIPDGNYQLLFAFGFGWNSDSQKFTRGQDAFKFDRNFGYSTRRVGGSIYYDTHSVTLYSVIGGNARTSKISNAEFDRY